MVRKFLFILLTCSGFPGFSQEEPEDHEVDSIIHLLNEHRQKDTVRLNFLYSLVARTTGENMKSFCDEAIELTDFLLPKFKDQKVIYSLKKTKGHMYSRVGEYYQDNYEMIKALDQFRKSLDVYTEINDKREMGSLLNNMAIIYTDQGHINQALEYYNTIMKLFEEINYKEGVANTYNNLGYLNGHIGENQKAIEYLIKSVEAWRKTKDDDGIATALNNLAQQYSNEKQYDKALAYFEEALNLYSKINNEKGLGFCYTNMAIAYERSGEKEKALDYYNKGLEIREKIGDKRGLSNSYYNIGMVLEKDNKLNKALDYGLRSLALAKEVGFPQRIEKAAVLLDLIYRKKKKYKEALEMYQLSIVMRDSIINQENRRSAIRQQFKYDYEKKVEADSVRQATQIKIEETRHQHEIEKQRTITYAGIAAGILMLVIAIISFSAYRQKRKDNRIITEQKHLVEEKQREILDSIRYAKRIQNSLLPNEKLIEKQLNDLNNNKTG